MPVLGFLDTGGVGQRRPRAVCPAGKPSNATCPRRRSVAECTVTHFHTYSVVRDDLPQDLHNAVLGTQEAATTASLPPLHEYGYDTAIVPLEGGVGMARGVLTELGLRLRAMVDYERSRQWSSEALGNTSTDEPVNSEVRAQGPSGCGPGNGGGRGGDSRTI